MRFASRQTRSPCSACSWLRRRVSLRLLRGLSTTLDEVSRLRCGTAVNHKTLAEAPKAELEASTSRMRSSLRVLVSSMGQRLDELRGRFEERRLPLLLVSFGSSIVFAGVAALKVCMPVGFLPIDPFIVGSLFSIAAVLTTVHRPTALPMFRSQGKLASALFDWAIVATAMLLSAIVLEIWTAVASPAVGYDNRPTDLFLLSLLPKLACLVAVTWASVVYPLRESLRRHTDGGGVVRLWQHSLATVASIIGAVWVLSPGPARMSHSWYLPTLPSWNRTADPMANLELHAESRIVAIATSVGALFAVAGWCLQALRYFRRKSEFGAILRDAHPHFVVRAPRFSSSEIEARIEIVERSDPAIDEPYRGTEAPALVLRRP